MQPLRHVEQFRSGQQPDQPPQPQHLQRQPSLGALIAVTAMVLFGFAQFLHWPPPLLPAQPFVLTPQPHHTDTSTVVMAADLKLPGRLPPLPAAAGSHPQQGRLAGKSNARLANKVTATALQAPSSAILAKWHQDQQALGQIKTEIRRALLAVLLPDGAGIVASVVKHQPEADENQAGRDDPTASDAVTGDDDDSDDTVDPTEPSPEPDGEELQGDEPTLQDLDDPESDAEDSDDDSDDDADESDSDAQPCNMIA